MVEPLKLGWSAGGTGSSNKNMGSSSAVQQQLDAPHELHVSLSKAASREDVGQDAEEVLSPSTRASRSTTSGKDELYGLRRLSPRTSSSGVVGLDLDFPSWSNNNRRHKQQDQSCSSCGSSSYRFGGLKVGSVMLGEWFSSPPRDSSSSPTSLIRQIEKSQSSSYREYQSWKTSKWGEDELEHVKLDDEDIDFELNFNLNFWGSPFDLSSKGRYSQLLSGVVNRIVGLVTETLYPRLLATFLLIGDIISSVNVHIRDPLLLLSKISQLIEVWSSYASVIQKLASENMSSCTRCDEEEDIIIIAKREGDDPGGPPPLEGEEAGGISSSTSPSTPASRRVPALPFGSRRRQPAASGATTTHPSSSSFVDDEEDDNMCGGSFVGQWIGKCDNIVNDIPCDQLSSNMLGYFSGLSEWGGVAASSGVDGLGRVQESIKQITEKCLASINSLAEELTVLQSNNNPEEDGGDDRREGTIDLPDPVVSLLSTNHEGGHLSATPDDSDLSSHMVPPDVVKPPLLLLSGNNTLHHPTTPRKPARSGATPHSAPRDGGGTGTGTILQLFSYYCPYLTYTCPRRRRDVVH